MGFDLGAGKPGGKASPVPKWMRSGQDREHRCGQCNAPWVGPGLGGAPLICDVCQRLKIIEVEIKTIYGRDAIYPVCDKARIFAELVGQSTLTPRDVEHIKALGYTVEVVSSQPKTL